MEWNSQLYDDKHAFVSEYGKALLEFVPQKPEQSILDLGCGTGALTAQLKQMVGRVVGVDFSKSMIEKARERFSDISFEVCDALNLPFENEFDVVFSNAVFHWIGDHHALLRSIRKVLRKNGRLICEFGAHGNIAAIENAFAEACRSVGCEYKSKFNFASCENFGKALSDNGFVTDKLYDYDRPTPLKDGELGLANWMKQFFANELAKMTEEMQNTVIAKTEDVTRRALWNGKEWIADYRRLRAVAHI